MENPFVTSGYVSSEYFCDRIEETKKITSYLTNGNNIALISPRRLGKTDLIKHCFAQEEIKKNYYTFIIDIYATSSLKDFVNIFGAAIIDTLKSKPRKTWESFLQVLHSLRQEITFDIDGKPQWSLGLGAIDNPHITLDEIFQYLNAADKPCLIAIDEFQQILNYPDGEKVEATLRTYAQNCPNAKFIYAGSQRHLMSEMFASPARPFYQSVTIINLAPIPQEKYIEFVKYHFIKGEKKVEDGVVEELYRRFDSITYYMQRIMNYLYMMTEKGQTCRVAMISEAINAIISDSDDTYKNLMLQMPEKQRMVFTAIAKQPDGMAKNISSHVFINKNHLQSSSTVLSAIKGLLAKDFVTKDGDIYKVYDRFLWMWMIKKD